MREDENNIFTMLIKIHCTICVILAHAACVGYPTTLAQYARMYRQADNDVFCSELLSMLYLWSALPTQYCRPTTRNVIPSCCWSTCSTCSESNNANLHYACSLML